MRAARALVFVGTCAICASCAVGSGTGEVKGKLYVQECTQDLSTYDMQADFFGANAYHNQLIISIQHGGGTSEYTDTLTIAVQDLDRVEADIEAGKATYDLAQFERPPGSPVSLPPPLVRVSLDLRGSCGQQHLNPVGDPTQVALEATGGTLTFTAILHGDIQSRDTNSKRIEGTFAVHVEDPRGWGTVSTSTPLPPGCKTYSCGDIHGNFKFFYQRGGPAQPFP